MIVSFENGNAEKPVSLGAMFNGKGKSGHGGAGNYMKGLQTASGCHVLFNDKKGSMNLSDKGNSNLYFDGSGNSTINTSVTQVINVGDNSCLLKMDSGGNITLDGTSSLKITIGASSLSMDAGGKITLKGKDITIEG